MQFEWKCISALTLSPIFSRPSARYAPFNLWRTPSIVRNRVSSESFVSRFPAEGFANSLFVGFAWSFPAGFIVDRRRKQFSEVPAAFPPKSARRARDNDRRLSSGNPTPNSRRSIILSPRIVSCLFAFAWRKLPKLNDTATRLRLATVWWLTSRWPNYCERAALEVTVTVKPSFNCGQVQPTTLPGYKNNTRKNNVTILIWFIVFAILF